MVGTKGAERRCSCLSTGAARGIGHTALHWSAAQGHLACVTWLIETGLEEFLSKRNVTTDMFVEACREARESGDLSTASLDYLLASTEYESFVRLAQDFALMNAWVPEDGADDTFGALEGGLED